MNNECTICLEILNNEIAILACGHKFHFKCISDWLRFNYAEKKYYNQIINKCPNCNGKSDIINVLNIKKTVYANNKILPFNFIGDSITDDKQPLSVITNNYEEVINTAELNKERDFISPNPEGSTEYRFVDETPKTAWSESNVSQHPKHYTSKFEDEIVDPSGFFNQDQFFHDNTSPHSQTHLPERCSVNAANEVFCNYNNRLQIIPPKLITDAENNLVLNSIGQGKGDIFKSVDGSNVKSINGNSYQVWEYENEKTINGAPYYGNVTGASPKNESYMAVATINSDFSF